jgi:Na+/phosphate symporter
LRDVENHIKEKGHLKDIPSASEVQKNGINLGEMDAKLLQKIEELTLYTIDQQKEIEELKKQNSKIDKLQNEIDELKALVQKLLKDKN